MKKKLFILALIVAALVLAAAIFGKFIYDSVDGDSVPNVAIEAFGVTLEPVKSNWNATVFKGMAYKELISEDRSAALDIGELTDLTDTTVLPVGYEASYELFCDDFFVSAGRMDQWREEFYSEPGSYELSVLLEKKKEERKGYGSFSFLIRFSVPLPPPEPEFFTGNTSLAQGEVFVMKLTNIPADERPAADTDLGMSVFTPIGEGEWFAVIPIGNTRAPGAYKVTATTASDKWEVEVEVKKCDFDTQNLIIDTQDPVISEANSPEAYAQYRAKIPPLFDTYDSEMYWDGTFIRPVSGRISTQFGSIRYTNSNWSNPRYHWGVDIAADKGTPVKAPNNGRVVFAEYLLNTGNTVVIEHGGGLKSYYFHMDALYVNAGEMVKKGDHIGDVGSTGYSTGAHLHFEMRIGNQAINPLRLCEGSASMYALEDVQ